MEPGDAERVPNTQTLLPCAGLESSEPPISGPGPMGAPRAAARRHPTATAPGAHGPETLKPHNPHSCPLQEGNPCKHALFTKSQLKSLSPRKPNWLTWPQAEVFLSLDQCSGCKRRSKRAFQFGVRQVAGLLAFPLKGMTSEIKASNIQRPGETPIG